MLQHYAGFEQMKEVNAAQQYDTLPHTATYCNILQYTATHCNTMQPNATQCNTLPYAHAQRGASATERGENSRKRVKYFGARHKPAAKVCNTLQHTKTH